MKNQIPPQITTDNIDFNHIIAEQNILIMQILKSRYEGLIEISVTVLIQALRNQHACLVIY